MRFRLNVFVCLSLCLCLFFVSAYSARNILLLSAYAIQRNYTQERNKFFHIIIDLKQHLFLTMEQVFIYMKNAE